MPTIIVDALGGGDYTNITDALASISDATASNEYTILVSAGTYTELGSSGYGLALKNYCNIEGDTSDPADVVIQSNGGGSGYHGIWSIANCSVSNVTVQAQTGDTYAVHIDLQTSYFNMENCVITHDESDKSAIGGGGRAGQIVILQDVVVTQGLSSIHGDVYSRATSSDIWEWRLVNCTMPSLQLIDFIEYKHNRVTLTNCAITTLSYNVDLTYYNLYPSTDLFNRGYLYRGIYLFNGGYNTIGSMTGIEYQQAVVSRHGNYYTKKKKSGLVYLSDKYRSYILDRSRRKKR